MRTLITGWHGCHGQRHLPGRRADRGREDSSASGSGFSGDTHDRRARQVSSSLAASTCIRTSTCPSAAPSPPTTSSPATARRRLAARRRTSTSPSSPKARPCARRWTCGMRKRQRQSGDRLRLPSGDHRPARQRHGGDQQAPEWGVTSLKLFMAYKGALMVDDATLFRAMEQAAQAWSAHHGACRERRRHRHPRAPRRSPPGRPSRSTTR